MTEEVEPPPEDSDTPLRIVSRKEWGALPARKNGIDEVTYPILMVGITYYTATPSCNEKEECIKLVRDIQQRHVNGGAPDIHYNFLIGGDGTVFEGQGWKYKPFRSWEDPEIKDQSLDIAYIGDWRKSNIPIVMFSSVVKLLLEGRTKDIVCDEYAYKGYVEECKL